MEIRHSDVLPTFDMMADLYDDDVHQHTQVLLDESAGVPVQQPVKAEQQ